MNRELNIWLAPEPCAWWVWCPPEAGPAASLSIDCSVYPDYRAMHEAVTIHDHAEYNVELLVHNHVTGGYIRCQWIGTDAPDPYFGQRHRFYSSAHGGITVELWDGPKYVDALRGLLSMTPQSS